MELFDQLDFQHTPTNYEMTQKRKKEDTPPEA